MTVYLIRHGQSEFNAAHSEGEPDPMIFDAPLTSGLVGSEESDLGFPLHPECAIQTYADWYFLHGIFG